MCTGYSAHNPLLLVRRLVDGAPDIATHIGLNRAKSLPGSCETGVQLPTRLQDLQLELLAKQIQKNVAERRCAKVEEQLHAHSQEREDLQMELELARCEAHACRQLASMLCAGLYVEEPGDVAESEADGASCSGASSSLQSSSRLSYSRRVDSLQRCAELLAVLSDSCSEESVQSYQQLSNQLETAKAALQQQQKQAPSRLSSFGGRRSSSSLQGFNLLPTERVPELEVPELSPRAAPSPAGTVAPTTPVSGSQPTPVLPVHRDAPEGTVLQAAAGPLECSTSGTAPVQQQVSSARPAEAAGLTTGVAEPRLAQPTVLLYLCEDEEVRNAVSLGDGSAHVQDAVGNSCPAEDLSTVTQEPAGAPGTSDETAAAAAAAHTLDSWTPEAPSTDRPQSSSTDVSNSNAAASTSISASAASASSSISSISSAGDTAASTHVFASTESASASASCSVSDCVQEAAEPVAQVVCSTAPRSLLPKPQPAPKHSPSGTDAQRQSSSKPVTASESSRSAAERGAVSSTTQGPTALSRRVSQPSLETPQQREAVRARRSVPGFSFGSRSTGAAHDTNDKKRSGGSSMSSNGSSMFAGGRSSKLLTSSLVLSEGPRVQSGCERRRSCDLEVKDAVYTHGARRVGREVGKSADNAAAMKLLTASSAPVSCSAAAAGPAAVARPPRIRGMYVAHVIASCFPAEAPSQLDSPALAASPTAAALVQEASGDCA
mmetsp:Transcript_37762/g.84193  ORF Transcript_37762/g.84193 Transcript_37762/m.84193 type:complete len:718 (-) Transcript_37762:1574-3727(-)|eukprot:CAMPEP_0202915244 /NCGR_PEP_ID=MMETSP1392-20130828/65154_1 /ASSEMBLY_ACC=CAM_ASM_000868 /TAXON_ID=225041 /ORGANISM="Chlamydomonas chlamydogama, Strain SAG 11-48b" /LENGTH=717 /DNA_ID=CAMNT_0049607183 /DNA_START=55 /DNA_END=2208 /DNA_ORIENTATION=-